MVPTNDNGFLLAGLTSLTGNGDFYIVRVDQDGNELWNNSFVGLFYETLEEALATPDGGFLVAGPTTSVGAGGNDAWLFKVDNNGKQEWNKTYGGSLDDFTCALLNDNLGDYLALINSHSYGPGDADMWIVKLDENGNSKWNQTYGYAGKSDPMFDMIEIDSNKIVLTGRTGSPGGAESDYWVLQITLTNQITKTTSTTSTTALSSSSSSPTTKIDTTTTNAIPGFDLIFIIIIPTMILAKKRRKFL